MTLQLNLMHIFEEAYKDFEMYQFNLDYTWTVDDCGQPSSWRNSGSIHHAGSPKRSCSWLVDVAPNERILFKINSAVETTTTATAASNKDCRNSGMILRYHGLQGHRQAQHFCLPDGELTSPFPLRFFYVELLSPQQPFHLEWNVLRDPAGRPDVHLCPNSSWAIPQDLVCNRKINCPQQQLYGYLLDEDKCKSTNYFMQVQSYLLIYN